MIQIEKHLNENIILYFQMMIKTQMTKMGSQNGNREEIAQHLPAHS